MGKDQAITIQLSMDERDLISLYGYPFDEIGGQIQNAGTADIFPISDASFWWERVIENLFISENEADPTEFQLHRSLRRLTERILEELEVAKNTRAKEGVGTVLDMRLRQD